MVMEREVAEGIEDLYDTEDVIVGPPILTPLDEAVYRLRQSGVAVPAGWWEPSLLPLIGEAVNWAAKTISLSFYDLKAEVVDAIAQIRGVVSGWSEDGTFVLYHPEVGTIHFHDPGGEIESGGEWPHSWSGVERQSLAFEALVNADLRRQLAEATAPDRVGP
jgi:hypothetical protein